MRTRQRSAIAASESAHSEAASSITGWIGSIAGMPAKRSVRYRDWNVDQRQQHIRGAMSVSDVQVRYVVDMEPHHLSATGQPDDHSYPPSVEVRIRYSPRAPHSG